MRLLQKPTELGLRLGSEGRHTLTVEPASRCPRAFADTLKDHKWLLLDLLRLPFAMVFSEALGETIFLCEDEDTRETLIAARALPPLNCASSVRSSGRSTREPPVECNV